MTRATWNQMVIGAVVLPLLGVAFAAGSVFLLGASDRAGVVIAYAIATMPLSAGIGALGQNLAARAPRGPWGLGAAGAMIGAVTAALVAATIRFHQAGATGFVSLSVLPFTAEFLMLAGVCPAVVVLGAGVAGRQGGRGTRSVVGWSAAAGAGSSALVGLVLIVVSALGSLPFMNPVVLWALVAAAIAGMAWRRLDAVR